MINFLLGLVLGALPDCLYYYLMIKNIKGIQKHKFLLFSLIFILYVLIYMILRYNFYLYLLFDILIYLILKLLYKVQITDFFMIIFIEFYFIAMQVLSYFLLKDYYVVALIINKIGIFIPLIFSKQIKTLYSKYIGLWNRNDKEKRKIKSLTLRNISLMVLNTAIVSTYLILVYIVSNLK